MERVSRFLEMQSAPSSRNEIETYVTGKRRWIRLAVEHLVREGFARETEGPNRARLIASIRPYRDGEFAPGSPREHDGEFAPTSPRPDPHGSAEFAGSPRFAPGSPPASRPSAAPVRPSPTGEANGRGELVEGELARAKLGDEFYPLKLAEGVRRVVITEREAEERLALHEFVFEPEPDLDPEPDLEPGS
jgi:hypothetical protein